MVVGVGGGGCGGENVRWERVRLGWIGWEEWELRSRVHTWGAHTQGGGVVHRTVCTSGSTQSVTVGCHCAQSRMHTHGCEL